MTKNSKRSPVNHFTKLLSIHSKNTIKTSTLPICHTFKKNRYTQGMLDRISSTEKAHLQSLVSSLSKDINDNNSADVHKKIIEIKSVLPKNSLLENTGTPEKSDSAKVTLKELIKVFDEYELMSTVSQITGDIASHPDHHILTDNYWTSSDYGPQKKLNFWRDADTVDSQVNRTYAQRHASVFLNNLVIGSSTDIPKTTDDRYSYMERSQKITTKVLRSVYLTYQLLTISQNDSDITEIITSIRSITNELPQNSLENIIKATVDLIATNKPTENRTINFVSNKETDDNSPKKESSGYEYFKNYLEPVLPKLNEIYKRELIYTDIDKFAVICLDRDARALMHSLKSYVDEPSKFIPLLANSDQFIEELKFYNDQIQNDILISTSIFDTPKSWSQEVGRRLDEQNFPNLTYWRDVFGATLENSLKNKTKVLIVDIGYHGSNLEMVRYILSKAFPNINFVTAIAYQSDPDIPIQKVADGHSLQAEEDIPKSVTGMKIEEGKLKYLQNTKKLITDSNFYKEIIEATKKFKAKTQNS